MHRRSNSSTCYRCGNRLTAEDKSGAYGSTHSVCRNCHRILSSNYSARHEAARDAYSEKWRRDNPRYMKKYYKKNKDKWEVYNKREEESK